MKLEIAPFDEADGMVGGDLLGRVAMARIRRVVEADEADERALMKGLAAHHELTNSRWWLRTRGT